MSSSELRYPSLTQAQAAIQATPGEEYGSRFKGWVRLCLVADSEKLAQHLNRLRPL